MDAVDLDHALGDGLEEPAVVADHQIREALGAEQGLEPDDAGEVEVIGRLVEEQHGGRPGELADDREPLPPAAGERVDGDRRGRRNRRG